MKHVKQVVQRRNGATIIDEQCPNDIVLYNKIWVMFIVEINIE